MKQAEKPRMILTDTTQGHVNFIADNMREIDRLECAAWSDGPWRALQFGWQDSAWVQTAILDGIPHAIVGIVVMIGSDKPGGMGVPWLLGTNAIAHDGAAFVKLWPTVKRHMKNHAPTLKNIVSCQNAASIRLLKHLGFTVGNQKICVGMVDFFVFEQEI